jgi:hypothetical protein
MTASSTQGEGYGLIDFALSTGQPVKEWEGGELAIGGSIHYLRGLAYQKVLESNGSLAMDLMAMEGEGFLRMRTALGGSGYSTDLGLAVRFHENYFFAVMWQNVLGKMYWNRETEERFFEFELEPITLQDVIDSVGTDSLISSNDTTMSIASFSSDFPSVIRLGFARKYDKFVWSFDWFQSIKPRPGYSLNPIISAGIEYSPASALPLRLGFSTGSEQGTLYSIGAGIKFRSLNLDIAWANSGSPIPSKTKGAKFAVGIGFFFM